MAATLCDVRYMPRYLLVLGCEPTEAGTALAINLSLDTYAAQRRPDLPLHTTCSLLTTWPAR